MVMGLACFHYGRFPTRSIDTLNLSKSGQREEWHGGRASITRPFRKAKIVTFDAENYVHGLDYEDGRGNEEAARHVIHLIS